VYRPNVLMALAALVACEPALATSYGAPASQKAIQRIQFSDAVLTPFAHIRFCLAYPRECQATGRQNQPLQLDALRSAELRSVNRRVNQTIRPQRNTRGVLGDAWIVWPQAGDCNDFAVTKRHELLTRRWPSSALLLAEVATGYGKHHLVLVVRTHVGDLVLDNLQPDVRDWRFSQYRWVRIQSPVNPALWLTFKPVPRRIAAANLAPGAPL
jgi:predicted transglutaminase-like cysteine proteinase